jgi:amino acid adenylation domain-containing protein
MTTTERLQDVPVADQRRKLLAQLLRDKARLSNAVYTASTAQSGLWFMQQLDPTTHAYHLPFCVYVLSRINPDGVKNALQQLVDRHSMLRTTFRSSGQQVEMVVHGAGEAGFEQIDAQGWSDEKLKQEVERCLLLPFDLLNGPLIRLHLFSRSESEHVFLLVIHHIVCDGWSLMLVLHEFMALYQASISSAAPALPTRAAEFSEFVLQQQQRLAGPSGQQAKAYWVEQLARGIPALDLPTSRPRPEAYPSRAASAVHYVTTDERLYNSLVRLAQSSGVTLASVILAAYQTLLMRLSGQQDIVVGMPMACRTQPGCEGVVGHFVNLVLIRGDLSQDPTFRDFIAQTSGKLQGAVENQDFPLVELVKLLRPLDRVEKAPLFRTMLNILKPLPDHPLSCALSRRTETTSWGPLKIARFPIEPLEENYDLAVRVHEIQQRLEIKIQFNCNLFDIDLIEHFTRCFLQLLESAAADPDCRLSRMRLLAAEDRERMLGSWNDTRAHYPSELCIHQLFEAQVERSPDAVAVAYESERLSYRQLNDAANRLAHYLRERGVAPDARVAICAERGIEMVVGLLGIMKAGGAYLPLDPSYPQERLAHMLRDSEPVLILTTAGASGALAHCSVPTARVDLRTDAARWNHHSTDNLNPQTIGLAPHHLAYVIYTSGSTGLPKGVMLAHRGIVNRLHWMQQQYSLDPTDRVLQKTPFGFDVSVWEFFWPLMVGARLVIARPQGHRDPAYLNRVIQKMGVTTLHFVPSMLQVFLDSGSASDLPSLRRVMCSGEELSVALQNKCLSTLPQAQLHNLYGPTEASIDATYWHCRTETGITRVPIGRPIANTRIYILDRHGEPVPVGVAAELYIGGIGVARGYLKRTELTAERFVADPFSAEAGARLYKTGDLARYRTDGNLEFLGRNDHQVKIRGFRIECGEIEAQLMRCAGIREAVVVVRSNTVGDRRLVAYLTGRSGSETSATELRAQLSAVLPEHMIPAAFVMLEALPLTPNGKLDRNALPAPGEQDLASTATSAGCVQPRNDTERFLIDLWKELLGISQLSPTDNFFAIGGHSLLAVQMIARLETTMCRPFPVALLFSAPTVRELSQQIDAFPPITPGPHVFTFRTAEQANPVILMPSLAGDVLQWREFVGLLDSKRPICGIYLAGEPDYAQQTSFEELAMKCARAIARAHPGMPCHLVGYSFGGTLAFEVARQLKILGSDVGVVAILDTGPTPPAPDHFGAVIRNSFQILRNLLSRASSALAAGQWRNEMRAIFYKAHLIRRKLAARRGNVEQDDEIAFEYIFGRVEMPEKTRRLMSWSLKLYNAYKPQRYRGDLLVLRASKRPLLGPFAHDLGWGPHVEGRVIVENFSGGHGQMIEQAQLLRVAELLNNSFEGFEAVVAPAAPVSHSG